MSIRERVEDRGALGIADDSPVRREAGAKAGWDAGSDAGAPAATGVEFGELWQHRQALHAICRRIVGDAALADDLVQETYVRALGRIEQLEGRGSLLPWLATVARRLCIDELRKRRYQTPVGEVVEAARDCVPDPAEAVAAGDTLARVRQAWATLTDREQVLLSRQLRFGESHAELARTEGSSSASVRSVLARARAKLRLAL